MKMIIVINQVSAISLFSKIIIAQFAITIIMSIIKIYIFHHNSMITPVIMTISTISILPVLRLCQYELMEVIFEIVCHPGPTVTIVHCHVSQRGVPLQYSRSIFCKKFLLQSLCFMFDIEVGCY